MLTPDEVLPFLQHQNPAVRDHALRYLVGSNDCGPTTADDLWQSIDRFGSEASALCLRHLSNVPQTQVSYTRLIAALRQVTDEWQRAPLEAAFMDLSWDLLDRNRDEVLSLSSAPEYLRTHHARRLALDQLSFDELWSALVRFAQLDEDEETETEGDDDKDDTDDGDNAAKGDNAGDEDAEDDWEGSRLVETLVRRFPDAAAERAAGVVRAIPPAGRTGWMDDYCVDILGRTGNRATVPLLLEQLSTCDDEIRPSITHALARLGNADLVAHLEAMYADETNGIEWFTIIRMLGGINLPETEAALARLLGRERDLDLRRALAGNLIDLCASPDAMEDVRQLIDSDLRHEHSARLAKRIFPAATMVGLEWPELMVWLGEIEKREAAASPWGHRSQAATAAPWDNPPLSDPQGLTGSSAVQPVGTIRRSAPKVGRNDACPCGSGKKYKKCCMKDEG